VADKLGNNWSIYLFTSVDKVSPTHLFVHFDRFGVIAHVSMYRVPRNASLVYDAGQYIPLLMISFTA